MLTCMHMPMSISTRVLCQGGESTIAMLVERRLLELLILSMVRMRLRPRLEVPQRRRELEMEKGGARGRVPAGPRSYLTFLRHSGALHT